MHTLWVRHGPVTDHDPGLQTLTFLVPVVALMLAGGSWLQILADGDVPGGDRWLVSHVIIALGALASRLSTGVELELPRFGGQFRRFRRRSALRWPFRTRWGTCIRGQSDGVTGCTIPR